MPFAIAANEVTTNQWFKNLVCDEIKSHFKFIYYWSKLKADYIEKQSSWSTFSEASAGLMKSLIILLPPLSEQKAIASILSSFDGKIELLREQNETLEKTAQNIFQEWFGKHRVDDELPEGWRVGNIYEFLTITYWYPFKSSLFNENEGLPLIRIRDLKDWKPQIYTPEKVDSIYEVNPWDILAWMDAEFSPVVYSWEKWLLNQRVCRFNPKEWIWKYFIIEFMRPYLYFYSCTKFWTTVSHLWKSDLDSIEAVIPSIEKVKEFSEITNWIFEKIVSNNLQIQILSKTRDELLPRLMKGEVRVF